MMYLQTSEDQYITENAYTTITRLQVYCITDLFKIYVKHMITIICAHSPRVLFNV